MSDKVDDAIEAAGAPAAPAEMAPADSLKGVAQLSRDPSKTITLIVPKDFTDGDCQAIMEITLQLRNAAFMQQQAAAPIIVPVKPQLVSIDGKKLS